MDGVEEGVEWKLCGIRELACVFTIKGSGVLIR